MASSIKDQIANEYRNGTAVNKLLIVNIAVYAIVVLILFFDWALHAGVQQGWSSEVCHYFSISSDWQNILKRIWSPFTCMFLHAEFGHILFNMIALMMFGNIVGDLIGDRRVFPIYLLGGLVGNLFFFISANVINSGIEHEALGASGAIMALAGAAVAIAPDYRLRLILIGSVALKYIVVFMILADLVSIAGSMNTGGHFAHIGGFIFGWIFVQQLNTGNDLSDMFHVWKVKIKHLFVRETASKKQTAVPAFKVTKGGRSAQMAPRQTRQETLDAILDKIRLQGMASLNEEEQKFLESLKDS